MISGSLSLSRYHTKIMTVPIYVYVIGNHPPHHRRVMSNRHAAEIFYIGDAEKNCNIFLKIFYNFFEKFNCDLKEMFMLSETPPGSPLSCDTVVSGMLYHIRCLMLTRFILKCIGICCWKNFFIHHAN